MAVLTFAMLFGGVEEEGQVVIMPWGRELAEVADSTITHREEKEGKKVSIIFPSEQELAVSTGGGKYTPYSYDQVFAPSATHEQVYEETRPLITSVSRPLIKSESCPSCVFAIKKRDRRRDHVSETTGVIRLCDKSERCILALPAWPREIILRLIFWAGDGRVQCLHLCVRTDGQVCSVVFLQMYAHTAAKDLGHQRPLVKNDLHSLF